MKFLIGSDLGTSGVKTILFDEKGKIVATAYREYPLISLKSGWSEQVPDDWWQATKETLVEIMGQVKDPSDVVGIGLSGQMHGLVLLDESGRVLRNSIIWCDQRTQVECLEIEEKIGRDRLIEITGNPALTGFTLSKLLWVMKHEPGIYRRCRHILLPKDYIRYKLTGEFATEVSDASGMQMLDLCTRQWSEQILNTFGIDKKLLPRVFESSEVTGRVTAQCATETGLSVDTIVAGGAGDQAAAAVGNGIVKAGLASCNIGSSGVIFAHTDKMVTDKKMRIQTLCHAVKGSWHVMGVTQSAGISIKWFKDNFYSEITEKPYIKIDSDIESCEIGSGGIYLPYLMGERSPHLDPSARGVFFGLSNTTNRAMIARAVMEGITFSLKDCLSAISDIGINFLEIRLCGGGSNSRVWRQMVADVFECPVRIAESGEAGTLGVAILAAVASGIYPDLSAACDIMIRLGKEILPNREMSEKYQGYYEIYRSLYPVLKNSFQQYSKLY